MGRERETGQTEGNFRSDHMSLVFDGELLLASWVESACDFCAT